MRILVCGGRAYADEARVWAVLDNLWPDLVIQGGARGADWHANTWCRTRGVPCIGMTASWERYGASAGPIRNGWMLEHGKPDLVLAFPGGKGTADMVRRARAAGVEVREEE